MSVPPPLDCPLALPSRSLCLASIPFRFFTLEFHCILFFLPFISLHLHFSFSILSRLPPFLLSLNLCLLSLVLGRVWIVP